jgi:hypothetical protein
MALKERDMTFILNADKQMRLMFSMKTISKKGILSHKKIFI